MTQIKVKQLHSKPHTKTYPITFSQYYFETKPSTNQPKIFQLLHKDFDTAKSEILTLEQILEKVKLGVPFKNGYYAKADLTNEDFQQLREIREVDPLGFAEKRKELEQAKVNEFKYTDLAFLDVDDVTGETDPEQVLKVSGAKALYFSYSHEQRHANYKMNRYRLIFELSETVKEFDLLQHIQKEIKKDLEDTFHALKSKNIDGKSNGIDVVTNFLFGTNKTSKINKNAIPVNVKKYEVSYSEQKGIKELEKKLNALNQSVADTSSEKELNSIVDYLAPLSVDYELWLGIAIGAFHTAQINNWDLENVARQLQRLDAEEHPLEHYYIYERDINGVDNPATIGTLIHYALEQGYKRKHTENHAQHATQGAIKEISNKDPIKEYIKPEQALNVLNSTYKTSLLVADTNTGKTTALVKASKEYLKQHPKAFIYIASPTTPLAEQTAIKHDLGASIHGNIATRREITNGIRQGKRLRTGTYDKTARVRQYAHDHEFILIVDEMHKEVTDYSYRHKAITNMLNVDYTKLLGATATPQELDFEQWENIIKYELEQPKVLADILKIVEFNEINDFDEVTLTQIQKEVKSGNKVVVLVDNKHKGEMYQDVLDEKEINVNLINRDTKESSTYRYLLEKEGFKKNVDVLIATRAISDGININNESKNYSCIIAPIYHGGKNQSEIADFYNLDLIRQTANRLRSQYDKIIVPFYFKEDLPKERLNYEPYNLENRYNALYRQAQFVKLLIEHTYKGNPANLKYSIVENINGLFYKNYHSFDYEQVQGEMIKREQGLIHDRKLLEDFEEMQRDLLTIDKRAIRARASRDKENYYKYNPLAFYEALERILTVEQVEVIHADKEAIETDVGMILNELRKFEAKSNQEKRKHLDTVLDPLVFSKVKIEAVENGKVREDNKIVKSLELAMNSHQYKGLLQIIEFLDHEQVIKELNYIDRPGKVKEMRNQLEAIKEIELFEETPNLNITSRIYTIIKGEFEGTGYTAKERDSKLDELARAFKPTKSKKNYMTIKEREKNFKQVFKKFFIKDKARRRLKTRVSDYIPINLEIMAKNRKRNKDYTLNDLKAIYEQFKYHTK